MGKECEFQFFDLKPTFKPNLTLEYFTLDSKLTITQSHISETILVPENFTFDPKLTIPQNYILLLDQSIDHYNSEMIFPDWSYDRDDFSC